VATHIAEQMSDAWAAVLTENLDPSRRIEALIRVQLHQISQSPAIPAILHSRELQSGNAALRAQFLELMTRYQTLLVDALTKGSAEGVFRSDLDPKDSAILLISLVQGLAIRWSLGQRAFSLEAEGGRLMACQLALLKRPPELRVTT
jgi:hypothetical protein